MVYVSESGLYRIMFSCRESNIPGTAPYAFASWVCDEVLPSLRRNGRYELEQEIRDLKTERGRRLWIILNQLDRWSFNARKRYFGSVCRACSNLSYLDEYGAPHVTQENLQQVQHMMTTTMSAKIIESVSVNQRLITEWLR